MYFPAAAQWQMEADYVMICKTLWEMAYSLLTLDEKIDATPMSVH